MRLDLISGFTRPKAKLDPIFDLKAELVRLTVKICRLRKTSPTLLEILPTHISTNIQKAKIVRYWKDLRSSLIFDKTFHDLLDADVIDDNGEYKQVRISQQITNRLNAVTDKPQFLSPPLFASKGGWIDSMYRKPFWMRIENDCFSHPTMLMRQEEFEENYRYFSIFAEGSPYPRYSQPFHAARGVDKHFLKYGTVFDAEFRITKGLLNMWYGLRF